MKGLFKRVIAGATVAAVLLSLSTVALAHKEMDNMVFAGYDVTDWQAPNRIYNEVIGGKYTNKQVLVPVAPQDVTWKKAGYEAVYPYAGYDQMYVEGTKVNITRYNNTFPQWETRRKDYMWELCAPYAIWERQQTKVNGTTWKWDYGNDAFGIPDSQVYAKSGTRNAVVTNIAFKNIGFGPYMKDGSLADAQTLRMYAAFGLDPVAKWNNAVANDLTVDKLSALDENGRYVVTDEEIANLVGAVSTKYVTAKFNTYNNDGLATKDIAAEWRKHENDGWKWDADTVAYKAADIAWTNPIVSYEMAEPYKQYQYLIVNGIVFDGKNGKEKIVRYTNGIATPKVTWKFAFFQNGKDANGNIDYSIYEVVERKYVDGVPAVDANGQPIYRVPTGEYGKTYFKLVDNGKIIEYRVVDKAGNDMLLQSFENYETVESFIQNFAPGFIQMYGYTADTKN